MSGRVGHRKRLICVNDANIRESHLYLTGHTDFFPSDCFGPSSSKNGLGALLRLDVDGLDKPVMTDIPTDARSGKPRRFFRRRTWVRLFFKKHAIKHGDTIAIERIGSHRYRIGPFDAKSDRQNPLIFTFQDTPEGTGPTIIELFAGAGGMALPFKNAGSHSVCVNQWNRRMCG